MTEQNPRIAQSRLAAPRQGDLWRAGRHPDAGGAVSAHPGRYGQCRDLAVSGALPGGKRGLARPGGAQCAPKGCCRRFWTRRPSWCGSAPTASPPIAGFSRSTARDPTSRSILQPPVEPNRNLGVMADTPAPDIDLLDGAFYAGDPHPTYTWMRETARVLRRRAQRVGPRELRRRARASRTRPILACRRHPVQEQLAPDDDRHGRSRALEAAQAREPRVHARPRARPRSYIRDKCDAIIDRVCEQGECDFVRDVAAPLPMVLIGDMLGVAPEDRDDLLRWSDDMVSSQSGNDRGAVPVGDARHGGVHRVLHARGRAAAGATPPTT